MSLSRRPRVLLIGPLPIRGDVIGGTKVSFAGLLAGLAASGRYELDVHNLSRTLAGRGPLRRLLLDLCGLVATLGAILDPRRRPDVVVFNASSRGALRAGPLVWVATRLRRVPLCTRLFGGDYDLQHRAASTWTRRLAQRTWLRSERVLLQTRALCHAFEGADNVRWFPTTRAVQRETQRPPGPARRFLFLSQLRREKGVLEALEAAEGLPQDCCLTLHGPELEGFELADLSAHPCATYAGPLKPAGVQAVLEDHDVLVFPSYYAGEGLPGVVIEALQAGLPVLCSRWRALPELVHHQVNGLLVEPRCAASLGEAMLRLREDEALYRRLAEGARKSGAEYRSDTWLPRFEDLLAELLGLPGTPEAARPPGKPRRERVQGGLR